MQPSRREFCGAAGALTAGALTAGCLASDPVDVRLGQLKVSNEDTVPHAGRVWLSTSEEDAVWEASFDVSADEPNDNLLPTALFVDGLPGEAAPYGLHVELDDETRADWALSEEFGADDDCVSVRVTLRADRDPQLWLSSGCDTVPQ